MVVFFYMSVCWATTPPMVTKDIASTGYGLENAASAKDFTDMMGGIPQIAASHHTAFLVGLVKICEESVGQLLRSCKVNIVTEGGLQLTPITEIDQPRTEALLNFCSYFYPGVFTILKNKTPHGD